MRLRRCHTVARRWAVERTRAPNSARLQLGQSLIFLIRFWIGPKAFLPYLSYRFGQNGRIRSAPKPYFPERFGKPAKLRVSLDNGGAAVG